MKTFILTMLMATLAITHARIGETIEQATVRYGTPTLKADGWTHFRKGDFFIGAKFYQGKIDTIEYVKYSNGASVDLSEVEVSNFLTANYHGKWVPAGEDTSNEWTCDDLVAFQDFHKTTDGKGFYRLQIFTWEAGKRLLTKIAADQTAAQAGF